MTDPTCSVCGAVLQEAAGGLRCPWASTALDRVVDRPAIRPCDWPKKEVAPKAPYVLNRREEAGVPDPV